MNLQNCKKIISIFVVALGLVLIPRVSFASTTFNFDGYSYDLSDLRITTNYYIIIPHDWYFDIVWNYSSDNSNVSVVYDGFSIGLKGGYGAINLGSGASGNWNNFGNSTTKYISFTANSEIYTNIPESKFPTDLHSFIKGDLPNSTIIYYLHIIGVFNNATININNGSDISENIVVTAQEDYYFTSVQNGFVLSNNDTIATYDITDLSGDFNLVATDFVTDLIGSDDPPVDPPVDPPTDDPIIIGDIEFTDTTLVGTWFSSLFSSAIDLFERAVPYILGLFGLYFGINWLVSTIKKS